MTEEHFRRLALDLPDAIEGAHMGHPDFRVKGKIFASLWEDGKSGMVKLTPEQQEQFVKARPGVFVPCNGAWGRGGATQVKLKGADKPALRNALIMAWRNTAPKRMVEELGPRQPPSPRSKRLHHRDAEGTEKKRPG